MYTVGPVLDLGGQAHPNRADPDKIMEWLDAHPESSVVFLCFGGMGNFGPGERDRARAGAQQRAEVPVGPASAGAGRKTRRTT